MYGSADGVPEEMHSSQLDAGVPAGAVVPLGAFTVRALVEEVSSTLSDAGVAHARAEGRDMVAAICDRPRFWPSVRPDEVVDDEVVSRARVAARQRGLGAPFAYAVGRAAFRYLSLAVNHHVLIPRQETEVLIDIVLEARRNSPGGVAADVGTGSGAIALALASEGRFERVIATEVSSDALAVARANALHLVASLRAPLEFRLGASLSPLVGECVDVLVCNPPYIAFEETKDLPTAVRDWEPAQALVCGGNGLAVTREVVRRAPECLRAGGFLAVEVDARRASKVAEMFAACDAFVDARIRRDLAGRERFVTATRK